MNPVAAVLAFAGVAVVLVAVAGMLRAHGTLARLHFLTPVTTLGGPLIGLGLVIEIGWNLTSAMVALTVVLLAVVGPVQQSATARLVRERR
ncbi:monovalent cation/H(+) antiporter subunit G [Amycolatopsis pigmentata]|uniref:Monovalent cation/H(+) antiporter subunit G n=1 Tax=Amycolatopsis pigmentata TaxID=450801 RepID=A0ABW5FX99_9PSEU